MTNSRTDSSFAAVGVLSHLGAHAPGSAGAAGGQGQLEGSNLETGKGAHSKGEVPSLARAKVRGKNSAAKDAPNDQYHISSSGAGTCPLSPTEGGLYTAGRPPRAGSPLSSRFIEHTLVASHE